ncbi:PilZ domain-containing protein [Zobellella endophytica]|uniref:PilZ domain-containing protein n=1 Tax=Zobellella endophytica TaxID=2116700 RepID=A0A2P7R1G7_9GAMM|nr:PilZ domain-containing protein [Zobellella endophytica]PSJ44057.1 PilZ domain-containing protein [Zobellella endophytica]
MDLSPYKALLNKLVPLSYHQDPDALLEQLLPDADANTRFQLQAEVRRLTSPCLRVLDLRSLFPEQCRPFRHQGLDHLLPPALAARFTSMLADYNGEYTRGLYEALIAELAALRKQPSMFNTLPWHLPTLGTRRKENRLRFVTPLELHLGEQRLRANSLDISVHGLLAQTPRPVTLPEQVGVAFPELAKTPGLACLASPRHYRLSQDEGGTRLKLHRQEPDSEWDQALTRFIEQSRPRYGMDAEDLYDTALAQCWGQALLETSLSLSLFFDARGALQEVLANRHGNKLLAHWQQQQPGDLLATLLSPERVLQLSCRPREPRLLYSFCHQGKSQPYYFVADQYELERQQACSAFVNEGLRAGTLRSYYLSIRELNFTDQAIEALDHQGSKRLQRLAWHIWLTPLPELPPPVDDGGGLQQLAPFLRQARPQPVQCIALSRQASKRQEPRFRHQTAITLKLAGRELEGHTDDISASGLKITLPAAERLDLPCLVGISLTELGKRSRQWKLHELPYRVVNQSGDGKVLHLHIEGPAQSHPGFQFFSALLEQNQDKLRARPDSHHRPAWLMWLCRQALQQPPSPAFILGRNDAGFYVQGAVACLAQRELMAFLSNEYQQAHFSRLVSRQLLQSMITTLHRPDGKSHLTLEIWTAESADDGKRWLLLNPDPGRRRFLLDPTRARGLRVSLLLLNRLQLRQLDYFVPEWEDLTRAALHKTQQLEQQLAELAALCQIFDITDLVRRRQRLSVPAPGRAPLPDSAG